MMNNMVHTGQDILRFLSLEELTAAQVGCVFCEVVHIVKWLEMMFVVICRYNRMFFIFHLQSHSNEATVIIKTSGFSPLGKLCIIVQDMINSFSVKLQLPVYLGLCVKENCVMTQFPHKGMCHLTLIYPLHSCVLPVAQGRSPPIQSVPLWANEHSVLSHIKSAPPVPPVLLVSAFMSAK